MRYPLHAVLAALLATSTIAAASPRVAQRPSTMGSAIAVQYSVHPDSLRPGEPVPVLACVANQNPSSTRDLEPGDAFAFEFTRGIVGACSGLSLALPSGSLTEADFTCSVDGSTLTLTYSAASAPWPPGQAICASVIYSPDSAPSMVLTRTMTGRVGGHAPGATAGVLLGVASDLGVAGPAGPAGPPGPMGPAGRGAIGERRMLHTTSEAEAYSDDPPSLIPGLETTVSVAAGASLLVALDLSNFPCYGGPPASADGRVYIEVDGLHVAVRNLEHHYQQAVNVHLSWLSGPLAAGDHTVRALLSDDGESSIPHYPVRCVGVAAVGRHPGTGRMLVLEVLP